MVPQVRELTVGSLKVGRLWLTHFCRIPVRVYDIMNLSVFGLCLLSHV